MSDFLGDLADRSVATLAAVRPRLPSMFEPVAAPSPLEMVDQVTPRDGSVGSIVLRGMLEPVESEPGPAGHRRPVLLDPPALLHVETERADVIVPRRKEAPRPASVPNRTRTGVVPDAPRIDAPDEPTPDGARELGQAAPTRRSVTLPIEHPTGDEGGDRPGPRHGSPPVDRSPLPTQLHTTVVRGGPASPVELQPPTASADARSPAPSTPRHDPDPSGGVRPVATPVRSLIPPPRGEASRPTSRSRRELEVGGLDGGDDAPAIHVTIGRIEVRATPPAAPAAAPSRSKRPAMGLDQYLRQRERTGVR